MTHYIADDVHSQRHSGDYCPGALRRSPGSDNYGAYKGMEHERDEALAQVALLEKRIQEQLGHPGPLGSHKRGDDPHLFCPACDWYGSIPIEARALLDRLQRAEAVVELAKEIDSEFQKFEEVHQPKESAVTPIRLTRGQLLRLHKALAAWEAK